MLRSSLCDYSYAYILVKGYISVSNTAAADASQIILNNAPFVDCISKINNTQVDR